MHEPSTTTPRIAYVVKKFPRLSETFILDEILGLQQAGAEVTVTSQRMPDEGRFHARVAELANAVVYLPSFTRDAVAQAFDDLSTFEINAATRAAGRLAGERKGEVMMQAARLAALVRDRGITHMHAHFMTGAAHVAYVAHLLCGTPFSVTAHAKDIYRQGVNWDTWREIARAAKAVVTVCDANRTFIEERAPEARIVRIYNGVNLVPDAERLPHGSREPGVVLAVGRLVEKKGFADLLHAVARVSGSRGDVRLVIVGDGEDRPALQALTTSLGLDESVQFTGALPQHEVHRWMRRAQVLAAPCQHAADGNQDALPTVLLEALACGLPVISTPIGGIPEIVDNGLQGLLVAERNPTKLAAAITLLLTDGGLWQRCSDGGPERVAARFSRAADATRQLLELLTAPLAASDLPARSGAPDTGSLVRR